MKTILEKILKRYSRKLF